MPAQFDDFGITFLYPDSWRVEQDAEAKSVSVESPEGAFMTITKFAQDADVPGLLARAQRAMHEEYEEVEREVATKNFSGFELRGTILRFVYLDLIVTSQLLGFIHSGHTYLIQIQAEDRDHDRLQTVFDAMLTSLCQHLSS